MLDAYLTPVRTRSWPRAEAPNNISPAFIFSDNFPQASFLTASILHLIQGQEVVMYNADFDLPLIQRTWFGINDELVFKAYCCMNRYARFVGQPATKPYHTTGYRSWKLTEAADQTSFVWTGKPHGAQTDAQATRHVWQWLEQHEARNNRPWTNAD